MPIKRVLIVLPNLDFDVTEPTVPWKKLTEAGYKVEFATESGEPGQCDKLLLDGVIFGQLGAAPEPKKFYMEMKSTQAFQEPHKISDIDFMEYDCIILPGGHAPGMRQYLESEVLRKKIIPFFKNEKKITAAICHGVLVLSRALDPETGKSLLYKKKTTSLPKYMERAAYYTTAWKLGKYYRTYEKYVEDELCEALENPEAQYNSGTKNLCGSLDPKYASVTIDGNYISARFPGDAYAFADAILAKLSNE